MNHLVLLFLKYTKTKELFEKNRDNENAIKMSKYMRDMFKFYGLATPKRKSFYKELLKEDKTNKVIDWEFLDKCYEDEYVLMFIFWPLVAIAKICILIINSIGDSKEYYKH